MNEMRVMAPEPENSANNLARLARGAMDSLFAFLDLYLIPAAPKIEGAIDYTKVFEPHARPSEHSGPTMFQIHAAKLARHVKRVEHVLRCLLFFLATRLISDPEARARLAERPKRQASPPQRRPYDPDMMVQLTRPEPRACFTNLPYASNGKSHSRSRCRRAMPLDWKEVEIAPLMARMAGLPKVLKTLDARAEALAARLLSGEIALSEAALKAPSIRRLGGLAPYEQARQRPRHCPVFLRHLAHWLPPPDLYADCHDDDRDTCNKLHSLAYEAVSVCDFS